MYIKDNENPDFMLLALKEAKKAAGNGEVPVGAVIVYNGTVIAKGRNMRERKQDALAHAEIVCIRRACAVLGSWRLEKCEMYVTLEPCPMCAGAIINSRLSRVYIAAPDPKNGVCGSLLNLFDYGFNHKPDIAWSGYRGEASELLKDFFNELRQRKNKKRNYCPEIKSTDL